MCVVVPFLIRERERRRQRESRFLVTLMRRTAIESLSFSQKFTLLSSRSLFAEGMESPETIQSLNPWVRIPDEWKNTYSEEGTTSSEAYSQPSSAESRTSYHQAPVAEARQRGVDADLNNEPYFDLAMMTNLSEQLGNHAFLRCRVKNLGDRTVRNFSFLTSLRLAFTYFR